MAKPRFNPNKPYSAADEAKPAFDPNRPYEAAQDGESDLFSIDPILKGVASAGSAIDSVTGAPTRAALGQIQKGASPRETIGAFADQFGADPEKAPSGRDLARGFGAYDMPASDAVPGLYNETGEGWRLQRGGTADFTPEGVIGTGLDVATDWTNLFPVEAAAKLAGKVGVTGAKMAGGLALDGAELAGKVATKAADLATPGLELGTKAANLGGGAVDLGKDIFGTTVNAVKKIAAPRRAENWDEMVKIGRDIGLDPSEMSEAIEFGPDSFVSRTMRNVSEGPAGEALLMKHRAGMDKIKGALDQKARAYSGGTLFNEGDAGRLTRDALKEGEEQFWKGIDLTHNTVQEYAPKLMMDREGRAALASKLEGVKREAIRMLKRGDPADKAQAQYLMNVMSQINNTNGSYKQLNEVREWVGKKAFPKKRIEGALSNDIEKLRDIYFTLNDGLIDTVGKHVNPDFAKELIRNNQEMSGFLKERSKVARYMDDDALPVEQILSGVTGDSEKVKALVKIMPKDKLEQFKGAYLANLVSRDADGAINLGKLHTAVERDMEIMRVLFSPEKIEEIKNISKIGKAYGPAILSSSGTGASQGFKKLLEGITQGELSKRVAETIKKRARKADDLARAGKVAVNPEAVKAGVSLGEEGAIDPEMLKFYGKRMGGLRDSKLGQAAKGAQVYSTIERDRREQVKERIKKRREGR
jgi:hypothetical protein